MKTSAAQTGYRIRPSLILLITLVTLCSCRFTSDSGSNAEKTLDKKLDIQFALYDEARDKAISRVVDEGGVILRDEWESWLTPENGDALTSSDLATLSELQEQEIETARQAALAQTTLDLDLIRMDDDLLDQYCREFPKGGLLHIHPGGTRNRQTVRDILEEVNPGIDGPDIVSEANDGELTMLYPDEIDFLSNLPVKNYMDFDTGDRDKILDLFFLPDTPPTHDFMRFEAIFTISDLLDQDPSKQDWVEQKTYLDFLERCKSQNVSYVEFTRVMWPDTETFEQLHTWAEDWYAETGIIVRWNSAFVRTLDYDSNTIWTREFMDILESNSYQELVGIDLLANETDTPALETGQNIYLPILAAVERGVFDVSRTMHAGELGLVSNVRDAMIMGAERVGHGVLLANDPVALEYAVKRKHLPIEINLYSNYRLKVCEDFTKHPFIKFLRLGMPISLSTDDEGMFVTDIVNEYKTAIRNTDITHEELRQMAYNSIETAFAEETVKTELLMNLAQAFETFEAKWHVIAGLAN